MRTIFAIVMMALGAKANAQDNRTLKQCIEYGLKNNRNNVIYANEKIASDARAKEVLASYLPKVSLTSSLDNNLKLQQTVIPAGVLGSEDIRVALTKQYNSNFTAQVDQVLYDRSLLTGLKANKYNKEKADLDVQHSQEEIIYNISTAYFRIAVYRQQLEQLESNKVTYEKQIAIYRLQVSKGITLQKDLDKVTVDYNNTLSQIRVSQSNITLAENELKFEMGYPISDNLSVAIGQSKPVPEPFTADSARQFLSSSRIEYKLGELDAKLLKIEQDRVKAEAFPKLSAYFRYGAVGYGNNLGESYKELLPFSAVGLKLSIPILDFFKRNAQYKQACINQTNSEEKLKQAEERYKVDYQNAQTKLLQASTTTENDERNVKLAESVFKVTDLQFQKGTTNLIDWLNTQNALKEAQNSYLNSLYNYYLARIDLEKAAGTLKHFYNSL